jgi:hypothetical protein
VNDHIDRGDWACLPSLSLLADNRQSICVGSSKNGLTAKIAVLRFSGLVQQFDVNFKMTSLRLLTTAVARPGRIGQPA